MEDDQRVRKLAEVFFGENFGNTEEVTTPDSSISTELSNDLFMKLQGIFLCKVLRFRAQWKIFINTYCDILFHSHRVYIKCVTYSCLNEVTYYEDIFEAFLSVCAFLKFFNEATLNSTGMNFRDLNTDVLMVVYDTVMKRKFCEEGGMEKFMEYVDGHGYFLWLRKDLASTDAADCHSNVENIQLEEETNRRLIPKTDDEITILVDNSEILIPKVLSATAFLLPALLNNPALIKCLREYGNEEWAEKLRNTAYKAVMPLVRYYDTSQSCSSSDSDSKTEHAINPENSASALVDVDETSQGSSGSSTDSKTDHAINPENSPLLGKMILEVLRHYNSRFSESANPFNPFQKKPEENM